MYKAPARVWRKCEEGKIALAFWKLLSTPSPLQAGARNVVGKGKNEIT